MKSPALSRAFLLSAVGRIIGKTYPNVRRSLCDVKGVFQLEFLLGGTP